MLKPAPEISDFKVHVLHCGCGHMVTAIHEDSAKAMMLEHVVFRHSDVQHTASAE